MKIFICWSQSRSKVMAEALRDWIPDVMQACEPWISSEDIDPGARWSSDLAKQLDEIQFGIICLTSENLNAPWIHFEAGAISKKLTDKTRVCPYLLDIEPTDVIGPLTQFQAIKADKEETRKLMAAINRALDTQALPDDRFNRTFDANWPRLEGILKNIPENTQVVKQPARKEKDMIEEILRTVREHSRILSDLSSSTQHYSTDAFDISLECQEPTSDDILRLTSDKAISLVIKAFDKGVPLRFEDLRGLTGLSEKVLSNSLLFLRRKNLVQKNENRTYTRSSRSQKLVN